MKKNLMFIGVILLLLLGVELYWYTTNYGNLIVYVQNQSDQESEINAKIYLDGNQVLKDKFFANEIVPKEIRLKKIIGSHELKIWRGDKDEIIKEKFNLFLVKWIIIDLYTEETIISYYVIPPLFQ